MRGKEALLMLFVGVCVALIAASVASGFQRSEQSAVAASQGTATPSLQATLPQGTDRPHRNQHPTATSTYAIPTPDPDNYNPGNSAIDDE